MPERFVIDININGANGDGKGDSGANGSSAGVAAGAALTRDAQISQAAQNKLFSDADSQLKSDGATIGTALRRKGFFKSSYSSNVLTAVDVSNDYETRSLLQQREEIFSSRVGSTVNNAGIMIQKNLPAIKTAGVAAAWKAANVAMELKNYKSGDSYENTKRGNTMKLATYGAALAVNPLIAGALVVNEGVNLFVESTKYNYDRKLERGEITNISQIAGNVSYGRGGR